MWYVRSRNPHARVSDIHTACIPSAWRRYYQRCIRRIDICSARLWGRSFSRRRSRTSWSRPTSRDAICLRWISCRSSPERAACNSPVWSWKAWLASSDPRRRSRHGNPSSCTTWPRLSRKKSCWSFPSQTRSRRPSIYAEWCRALVVLDVTRNTPAEAKD